MKIEFEMLARGVMFREVVILLGIPKIAQKQSVSAQSFVFISTICLGPFWHNAA